MSIMPQGGWGDLPPLGPQQGQDANQLAQIVHPAQPDYTPRRSYLTCKVCDSGTLSSKTVFRMCGPVVAIGFILLIPSILGMLFSAFVFIGANSVSPPHQPYQSAEDAKFRKG